MSLLALFVWNGIAMSSRVQSWVFYSKSTNAKFVFDNKRDANLFASDVSDVDWDLRRFRHITPSQAKVLSFHHALDFENIMHYATSRYTTTTK